MIIVPYQQLDATTLQSLIEEFVTRDGAIQGHCDIALSAQIAAVLAMLKSGKAVIIFDESDETCTIAMKDRISPA
jgi:uncharacterized protein YheU (UPF0270 family)